MYDAIIIGARCAGSPLGMLMARAGHRVLVVDRATFPSDALSTHAVTGDAPERIARWGLWETVTARTAPTQGTRFGVQGQVFDIPGVSVSPRRTVLDKILVDAAREAGAEVREGFSVSKLLRDDAGAVCGIEGRGSDGETVTERARIVIGADGRNSMVAKEVAPEEYNALPGITCGYYSYFEGYPHDNRIEVHFGDGLACFVFPTSDGQVCLGTEHRDSDWEALRADTEGEVARSFERLGLGEAYARAKRVEEWRGVLRPAGYFRKPFGPGWALVGDAGYLKDPILGQGINDAFRDAELLANALHAAWKGETPLEVALGGYQQARDGASGGVYALNHEFSKLAVTPGHVQMLIAGIEMMKQQAAAG